MPSSTKRTIDELAAAAEAEYRRLEPRIVLLKDAVAEEKALTKRLKAELSAMRVALAEARGTTTTTTTAATTAATTRTATTTDEAAVDAPTPNEEEFCLDDFDVYFASDARDPPSRKPPVPKPTPAHKNDVPHGERHDWADVNCPFAASMGWASDKDVYHSITKFFVDTDGPKTHSYIKKLTYDASRLFRSVGAPWSLNVSSMLHHLEAMDAAAADASGAAEARMHLVAMLQFAKHPGVTQRIEDLRKVPAAFKKRLAKFTTAAKVLAAMHDKWQRVESAHLATDGDALDALGALEAIGAQPPAALVDEEADRMAWESAERWLGL